jgi:ferredoxin
MPEERHKLDFSKCEDLTCGVCVVEVKHEMNNIFRMAKVKRVVNDETDREM